MILSNASFFPYWAYYTFRFVLGTMHIKFLRLIKSFKGRYKECVSKIVPETSENEKSKIETWSDRIEKLKTIKSSKTSKGHNHFS